MTEYSAEYIKAITARMAKELHSIIAADQLKKMTFKPSDFHNLPCKPMRAKR